MSSEVQTTSTGSKVVSAVAFPALFTAPEIISIIKRKDQLPKEVETFQNFIKNAKKSDTKDIFAKGMELSSNYDVYKSAYKEAVVKVPLKDKLLNPLRRLFKKDIVTVETVKAQKEGAIKYFETLKTRLANGENVAADIAQNQATKKAVKKALGRDISKTPTILTEQEVSQVTQATQKVAKDFAKTNATTLSKIGTNFKKELTSPLVLIFTALEAIPDFKQKVIPAFKEKGFKEGMKQTGLAIFKAGTNIVSFAAGSTLGRAIGGAIGVAVAAVAGPYAAAAAAIGSTLGSIFGISATNKISEKIVKKVEDKAQNKNIDMKM